jgi:hypothetical protein
MCCRRTVIWNLVLLILVVLTIAVNPRSAIAIDKFWIGPAAGSFSDDNNWATSGGACLSGSDTTAPVVGDIAHFTSSCINDAAIDASIDVDGVDIAVGYTGTITQNAGVTITVGALGWMQAGGSYQGSDSLIDLEGDFDLTGGSFTSTSGIFQVAGHGKKNRSSEDTV